MEMVASISDVWLVAPAIILFICSIVPITIKVVNGNREQVPFATIIQSVLGIVVSLWVVVYQWDNVLGYAFNNALVLDGLSSWSNVVILLSLLLTLFLSSENKATNGPMMSEHVFLLISATIGMIVLTWANDLIVTFISMELMALSFYVLSCMSLEQKLSKEAAFKYFILGSFGSAIFLYGVALIYGVAGTTYIDKLSEVGATLLLNDALFLIGVVLLISGILFKLSIFPFHAWTPDVYQGSPTPVTTYMATGSKLAMFVVLLRFVFTDTLIGSPKLVDALQWLSIITMLVGNAAALRQENMKRMLAYSGIAHSGYIMVGIIVSIVSNTGSQAASSTLFYLLSYSAMTIGTFGFICLLEKDENTQFNINDLKGLSKKRPGSSLILSIFLLSLAGIPPTVGFFSKFYLFGSAINEGLIWLAIWGVINSVISVYFYLRPIVYMYMYDAEREVDTLPKTYLSRFALATSLLFVILAGIFSDPFLDSLEKVLK